MASVNHSPCPPPPPRCMWWTVCTKREIWITMQIVVDKQIDWLKQAAVYFYTISNLLPHISESRSTPWMRHQFITGQHRYIQRHTTTCTHTHSGLFRNASFFWLCTWEAGYTWRKYTHAQEEHFKFFEFVWNKCFLTKNITKCNYNQENLIVLFFTQISLNREK